MCLLSAGTLLLIRYEFDPIRSDLVRSGPVRSGPVRSDPTLSDPIRSGPIQILPTAVIRSFAELTYKIESPFVMLYSVT